ncbi:mobile mystery protein B [Lysobacter sp. S4-A87]|uniref:mobile mystery protein B n=1 Tax=Lysobacter sp. S4-A87 TaxID=2925843 RepID=UPI001F53D2EE|nr:mobile mystery protein B [Lysobacter sp. S4-A87]UNK48335.1 mobile mystery protein B [Lysobacter sp. S4-A87]
MQANDEIEDGQTPLDPDEAHGLIPNWVATRGDLNEVENENINLAYAWADNALRRREEVASDQFLRGLHTAMFGLVWTWAGTYRNTERNIGVAPHQISTQLRQLFDDTHAWREFNTYAMDEQAYRLHHRLTAIHPFPNGNGRSSRLMADYYLTQNGAAPFTWGVRRIQPNHVRRTYLEAIREADSGNYAPLAGFVRG